MTSPLYEITATQIPALADAHGRLPIQVSRGTIGRGIKHLKTEGLIHTAHDGTRIGPHPTTPVCAYRSDNCTGIDAYLAIQNA